jgi:hypothetical protein
MKSGNHNRGTLNGSKKLVITAEIEHTSSVPDYISLWFFLSQSSLILTKLLGEKHILASTSSNKRNIETCLMKNL